MPKKQTRSPKPAPFNSPRPNWFTYAGAAIYTGVSGRTVQNWEAAGLIKVSNVILPGAKRGRKLICRKSLDRLLEGGVGVKTAVPICPKKGEAEAAGTEMNRGGKTNRRCKQ